jgi:NAD(P)-dependent dehydrogenase (short-subunit alcohol dehydrogenase family)
MSLSPEVEAWFSLAGKKALVTGGSRGIGKMIATGLLMAGAEVAICARDGNAVAETVSQLRAFGSCSGLATDLSTDEGRARLATWATSTFDSLDVLVNNAGTGWGAKIDDFPVEGFDKVLRVNLTSVFDVTKRVLPALERAASPESRARIINIGSVDGLRVPIFENYSYSASKAAIHMLTRHMARDLLSRNINVNCIAPGFFVTKMTAILFDESHPNHIEPPAIPMGRTGTLSDIASAAIYLAAPASAYVTGVVLPVAGGISTVD